jgi:hypothetical protein
MLDEHHDLVPLGRVWEFLHDQAAILMAEIERQFRNAQVPIFGRRPGKVDRELIAFPVDYEIDWLGQRSLRGADYCEPRACRRLDLSAPWRKEYSRDVFEDLMIPLAHWNQIARKLRPSGALPSRSSIIGSAATAAKEPRGSATSDGPDIWLTPAQAVYFLVTGDNLVAVSRLSHEVVIGKLGRIQSAFVPLSAVAGPEERAAARKEAKERLAAAGESPCAVAIKWRDDLLAAGLVAAVGRRTPSSPYETIKPVEFCDLRFAGLHAENGRGVVVFYNMRMSGSGLWRARQQAIALDDMAPPAIESAKVPSDQLPPHAIPERSSKGKQIADPHARNRNEKQASVTIQQRAAYKGPLELWMAQQQLSVLQKIGPAAIARQFDSHCAEALPALVPLLPKRLRSMEGVIERIIKRRVEALRTKNRSPQSFGNSH